MSQVTEQSVRFQTALASIKRIQASAVLDLTEDDFDFLTSNKVWIATDRSRARRCVEACVYGTLDFVGYPRFPAPVEFIAAVIAYYVHPVNIQTACLIMKGAEFREKIINGGERPVKAIKNVFRKSSAFHDEPGRLNVDGMNIISNDGSNKLNRSRKARGSYKVQRTIKASINAATSTRAVSSNPNFVTRQKSEIIFG